MILVAILVCEVAFWIAILAGLTARYVLRRPRLGGALLIAAPIIDVVLLVLVTVDLLRGGTASWHHGLAGLYIGISIAYGHRMIGWMDARFAARFRGVPRPAPLSGAAYAVACWKDVARTLLAVVITAAILGGLIVVVADPARTAELLGIFPVLGVIVVVDLLWAISYSLWPKRARSAEAR
ncbi:putative membrane protein [Microbacterium testaceum]|uniref:hypothetical protein n=1 Tax=Microbacterium TaxID=33882 RepID=UPI00278408BB|nr:MULTISPECIES: hypothetical protein [Microbacterium]MDQ1111763.1 putative membrane protein [Microbacterium testaceum]MDR6097700.1 putative membrane protein [Microbacterium sp. SORGH_AS_0454]